MAVNYNSILIRYGEIFLKGNNRYYFESLLVKNIKSALAGFDYKFVKSQSRYYVEDFNEEYADEIISRLTKVFGIHSISPSVKVKTDLLEISRIASEISPKSGSFRVTVKRADKRINMRSMDIAAKIGGDMLMQSKGTLTVELFTPEFELNVDIRENGYSYASLSVQKDNYAVRLYQKTGFRIFRETDEEYIMIADLVGDC